MRYVQIALLGCVACGNVVSDGGNDFTIALEVERVRIAEGSSATVGITLQRDEFVEPVTVTVGGLPAGVTVDPLTIDGTSGTLTLRVAQGAAQGDAALTVTAAGGDRTHDAALGLLAMGPTGTLDKSFGFGGLLTMPPRGRGNALLIQPDGKIVVAGVANGANQDLLVARYLPNGAPDMTFSGGVVTLNPTTLNEVGLAVALQSDGKIVVAGTTSNGGADVHGLVVRFTSDGKQDLQFGSGGRTLLDLQAAGAQDRTSIDAVVVQPDGGIVVAGRTEVGVAAANVDAVVARLGPNGLLDGSFGSQGRTTTPLGAETDRFLALARQPDGKIVAVGAASIGTTNIAAFARFNTDGRLDNSFRGIGRFTLDVGDSGNTGNDFVFGANVALLPDGKILAAGGASAAGGSDACMVRLNGNDGSADLGFGTGGVKVVSLGSGNVDFIKGLAVQGDGKLVLAGGTLNGGSFVDTFVARFAGDGLLDLGFAGGFVTRELGNVMDGADQFEAVTLDDDGRILATGFFFDSTLGVPDTVLLARFWP